MVAKFSTLLTQLSELVGGNKNFHLALGGRGKSTGDQKGPLRDLGAGSGWEESSVVSATKSKLTAHAVATGAR